MPERTVYGPAQDYLIEEEAAAWLRISVDDFREYVKQGLFPRGVAYGKRPSSHRWPWMDLVAVGHLLSRGHLKFPGITDKEDS